MAVNRKIEQALARLALENRERDFRHHTYEEDMRQYEFMVRGDPRAVEEGARMFRGPTTGTLSDDALTNCKYLFVASVTLACRFCIEGGMAAETAYNLSDLYIRRADQCRTVEELFTIHDDMFRDYTGRMRELLREHVYSRAVRLAMDYVEGHLHEPLGMETLAGQAGLSPAYFSTLFKRESGITASEFVRRARVDAAGQLLQYTDYSCLEIAEYLCFSSEGHMTRVFRSVTGMTPTEYRRRRFRGHWAAANKNENQP